MYRVRCAANDSIRVPSNSPKPKHGKLAPSKKARHEERCLLKGMFLNKEQKPLPIVSTTELKVEKLPLNLDDIPSYGYDSDFVEKRDDGSNMRAWMGRERFDQTHNIRVVIEHRKRTVLTSHFRHWRFHVRCAVEVQRRYIVKVSALCKLVLTAWKAQAALQHRTRELVVSEWRDFSLRLLLIPFRAWFVWTAERVARHRTQTTLLNAYVDDRSFTLDAMLPH